MVIRKFVIAIITKYSDRGVKKANRDLANLAKQAKKAALGVKALDKAQDQAARAAVKTAAGARKAGAAAASSGRKAKGAALGWAALGTSMRSMGPLALNVARGMGVAALGVVGVGAAVVGVGAKFESLRAQLNNLLGGVDEGTAAFKQIQGFAKSTPFQVEQITESFIKLQNRGIKPTEERLTAFGDIAAANGKELDQVTEAVLDATQGEGERLKELGIRMKVNGDKVSLAFKGQTTEVDNTEAAITNALVGFGQLEGVSGSMAVQMDTTKGVISNLKDGIANFFDQVAQLGVLDEFKGLLKDIANVGGDGEGLAGTLASSLIKVLKSLREAIQSITKEDVESFFTGFMDIATAMATVLDLLVGAMRVVIDVTGSTEAAFATLAVGTIALQAAFMGPAGLVFAAGAAGVAIGALLNKFLGASDAVEGLLEGVTGLDDELAKLDALSGGTTAKRGAPGFIAGGQKVKKVDTIDLAEAAATAAKDRALSRGISEEGAAFFAQQAREDVRETAGAGRASRKATEAIARGEGAGESPLVRRAAMAALEQEVSGDLAKLEGKAAKTIAGKRKKRPRRKGKGRKKAKPTAVDDGTENILDVLGLKGPGAVMEKRPPPHTLIINLNVVVKMIENLVVNISAAAGSTLGQNAAAAGAEIATALESTLTAVQKAVVSIIEVNAEALVNQQGGGRQLPGVSGG